MKIEAFKIVLQKGLIYYWVVIRNKNLPLGIIRADLSIHNYGSHNTKELALVCNHDGSQINCKNEITIFIKVTIFT
jgi:hypothetical protein